MAPHIVNLYTRMIYHGGNTD